MTKEELLESYQFKYSFYQRELDTKSNKLDYFYNFIADAYIMAKLRMGRTRTHRIINVVKEGTTRMFWPVVGHFNLYPACSFYDADNKLLNIQEEMILEYQRCLDTLVDIVGGDNISVIYPLMRVTLDCFNGNLALIDRVSLKMRDMMIGRDVLPIDYTRFDLDVFLNFFDGVIGGRESLESRGKTYQKIGN